MGGFIVLLALAVMIASPVLMVEYRKRRRLGPASTRMILLSFTPGLAVAVLGVGVGMIVNHNRAADGGYESVTEMLEAEKAGFSSKADYDAHLQQEAAHAEALAAQKREAEEARLAEKAAAEAAANAAEESKRLAEEAACRESAVCWGKRFMEEAGAECRRPIQNQARYDFEWLSGTYDRFLRVYWHDKDAGQVTFLGDQLKFQNGFGAWIRAHYSCTYDPATKTVLAVEVGEGRLSR